MPYQKKSPVFKSGFIAKFYTASKFEETGERQPFDRDADLNIPKQAAMFCVVLLVVKLTATRNTAGTYR